MIVLFGGRNATTLVLFTWFQFRNCNMIGKAKWVLFNHGDTHWATWLSKERRITLADFWIDLNKKLLMSSDIWLLLYSWHLKGGYHYLNWDFEIYPIVKGIELITFFYKEYDYQDMLDFEFYMKFDTQWDRASKASCTVCSKFHSETGIPLWIKSSTMGISNLLWYQW